MKQEEENQLNRERSELLQRLEEWLELPLIVLGFVWLLIMILELLGTVSLVLQIAGTVIWLIFIADFIIKLLLAPGKAAFLKLNIITLVSLLIPALRIFRIAHAFRILRTFRAMRGLRLVRVIGSLNRGMRSLGTTMRRRGFGYILLLTLVMLLLGAAGMYAAEKEVSGFSNYGAALWWTAMLFTSMGSEYWPQTSEGKALCLLLTLYGFGIFGYFTATLATFFLGRDAEDEEAEIAGAKQIHALQQEVVVLRQRLEEVLHVLEKRS